MNADGKIGNLVAEQWKVRNKDVDEVASAQRCQRWCGIGDDPRREKADKQNRQMCRYTKCEDESVDMFRGAEIRSSEGSRCTFLDHVLRDFVGDNLT